MQEKNIKLKIIAPNWSNEFELPDGSSSVSDIQSYIKNIKKQETLPIFTSTGLITDQSSK